MKMYIGTPDKFDVEYDKLVYVLLFLNGFTDDSYNFSLYESNSNFIIGQYRNFIVNNRLSYTIKMNRNLRNELNKKRNISSQRSKQIFKTIGSTKTIISSLIVRNHPAIQKEVETIRKDLGIKEIYGISTWEQYENVFEYVDSQLFNDLITQFFNRFPALNRMIWTTPIKILTLSGKLPIPHVPPLNKFEIETPSEELKPNDLRDISRIMRLKFLREENNAYPKLIIKTSMNITELQTEVVLQFNQLKKEMNKLADFSDSIPESPKFMLFLLQHYVWLLKTKDNRSYKQILVEIEELIFKSKFLLELSSKESLKKMHDLLLSEIDESVIPDSKDDARLLRNHVTDIKRYYYNRITS